MAEFGRPDRHRKDVQNALILIWQENVIWRAFFMINYIGDFERVLGWQNLVVHTDTEKMSRML